jgi:hypothetical protein
MLPVACDARGDDGRRIDGRGAAGNVGPSMGKRATLGVYARAD